MIDLVTLWASAASIGCIGLAYLWLSARIDLDEARADLTLERSASQILDRRVTVLRKDVVSLEREIGRLKAEQVAAKPKRGPGGKFVAKKPKPISCG